MRHAVFACFNALAVGLNLGVMFGGGKFDPLAISLAILVCGLLAGYELAKLKRIINPPPNPS